MNRLPPSTGEVMVRAGAPGVRGHHHRQCDLLADSPTVLSDYGRHPSHNSPPTGRWPEV